MKELKVHPNYIQEIYAKRDDLLYFREFHINKSENEGVGQSKVLTVSFFFKFRKNNRKILKQCHLYFKTKVLFIQFTNQFKGSQTF